jgi:transposase InsO family protein
MTERRRFTPEFYARVVLEMLTEHKSAAQASRENGIKGSVLSDYQDFRDAASQIGRFIEQAYMTKRIHSALGYLTPAEFESTWWRSQTQPVEASP